MCTKSAFYYSSSIRVFFGSFITKVPPCFIDDYRQPDKIIIQACLEHYTLMNSLLHAFLCCQCAMPDFRLLLSSLLLGFLFVFMVSMILYICESYSCFRVPRFQVTLSSLATSDPIAIPPPPSPFLICLSL